MSDDDWERLKNFGLFKMWVTDKELEEMGWAPLVIALVVLAVAIGIGVLVHYCSK